MSDESWFSTKLRFVIMIETIGGRRLNECVFLFRATDFDAAFQRALDIGRTYQEEYLNYEGQRVIWKLMEVISLDIISAENLDGVEVYSEPIHLSEENIIPFGTEFSPETSKPTQTI